LWKPNLWYLFNTSLNEHNDVISYSFMSLSSETIIQVWKSFWKLKINLLKVLKWNIVILFLFIFVHELLTNSSSQKNTFQTQNKPIGDVKNETLVMLTHIHQCPWAPKQHFRFENYFSNQYKLTRIVKMKHLWY